MRAIWIWSMLWAVILANANANNILQIKSNLERLQAANNLASGIRGGNNDQLAIETQRLIQMYVREADQNDWATPSSKRLKRLNEVADTIQPYTSLLVQLGSPFKKEFKMEHGTVLGTEQYNQGMLNLLSYAKPSDKLRQELLQLANVPNPRGAAKAAYNLIFQLGLDTPDVRQEIVMRMAGYQESDESTASAEIYFSAGAEWRIKEAVPLYADLLQSSYRDKTELNWRVRSIAAAVRPLGSQAADLLPLLQQQVARMKAEGADFRDINVIEGAIRAIEGKDPIEPLLSVNGAGPMGANPLPRSSAPSQAMKAQTTPTPPTSTPDHPPKPVTSPSPDVQAESPKPLPWSWIIGAILVLAVGGGILLKLRRK